MPIQRALLSVSDKTGLIPFAQRLAALGVEMLSTGGTAKALRDAGLKVTDISDHTGFPEMLDGRVKTLHPKVHGGLLGIRDEASHTEAMREHGITPIDLVVVTLYPFEQTVAKGADYEECIKNIDIGGPAMIRSASKNHAYVTVITDTADYEVVISEIAARGDTTLQTRKQLAAKAFARTAAYDAAIARWFSEQLHERFPRSLTVTGTLKQPLHYGENPHQKAAFYANGETGPSLATAQLAHGDRLSYNNLNDASAALELAAEFSEPAVAIIKHANPCGVATGSDLAAAYAKALACDPVSAYGGIIAVNRDIDAVFAQSLGSLFVEVLIAPSASAEAIALLTKKKKLRVLLTGAMPDPKRPRMTLRSVSGGFLYQEEDSATLGGNTLHVVSKATPSSSQMADMHFAFTVAKHVKSNAIILVRDGATIGIGAGQMSRIDSTRIACWKAKEAGLNTAGSVLASDAFFPFPDNIEMAKEAGIQAIIQPGGSIRDDEVIAAADTAGIAMVFTGMRHFRH